MLKIIISEFPTIFSNYHVVIIGKSKRYIFREIFLRFSRKLFLKYANAISNYEYILNRLPTIRKLIN